MVKRKYRKIDVSIWNDEKFASLSDQAKLIFLFSLTHPSMTSLGAMRASVEGLSLELWGRKGLSKGFAKPFHELFGKGFVKHDEMASFWWFPNFLKYNSPENPNIIKSWENALYYLPECNLKLELIQYVKGFVEGLPKGYREGLPKPFLKGLPIQITDNREQITEKEETKGKKNFDYHQRALEFYNIYPKQTAELDVIDAYRVHVRKIETHEQIIDAVRLQTLDREYASKYGVFYTGWHNPARYIRKHLWKDKIYGEEYYREQSRETSSKRADKPESDYDRYMRDAHEKIEQEASSGNLG